MNGGKREGAGRKPIYGIKMAEHTVILDEHSKGIFLKLGDGKLSKGARRAAELAEQKMMEVKYGE